jgi:hypothetical protein
MCVASLTAIDSVSVRWLRRGEMQDTHATNFLFCEHRPSCSCSDEGSRLLRAIFVSGKLVKAGNGVPNAVGNLGISTEGSALDGLRRT